MLSAIWSLLSYCAKIIRNVARPGGVPQLRDARFCNNRSEFCTQRLWKRPYEMKAVLRHRPRPFDTSRRIKPNRPALQYSDPASDREVSWVSSNV
jgi:hypothetical protein